MAKQKKLYVLETYGQLGNQLTALANLLAFAIEYDYVVIYPQSDYLSKYLQITKERNKHLRFRKLLVNDKITSRFSKIVKLLFFNRNSRVLRYLFVNNHYIVDDHFDKANQPDVIIVSDWMFRWYDGVIKHQDPVRKQLCFLKETVDKGQQKWLTLQKEFPDSAPVGLHIRRGDYAQWKDGIYFYDNATYYKWMMEISKQVEKPVFIVCSDESISFENENDLNIVYAKGSPTDDLFMLAQCKYILGPPSTFSGWAAYSGDRCLFFARERNEHARIENFKKFYLR